MGKHNSFLKTVPPASSTWRSFSSSMLSFSRMATLQSSPSMHFGRLTRTAMGPSTSESSSALCPSPPGEASSRNSTGPSTCTIWTDGKITRQEMLEIIEAIYKMVGTVIMMRMNEDGLTPQQRVDKIFSKMDKDHNDEISLDEFKEAAKSDPSIVLLLQCDMQK
ncbi:hypothetical protein KUCAC02_011573 [Chaenocephalus aceratus]|uniref:Uncharacterized protein n=1 Tax=Chaenocephalus aceratus TaxID=36190 RepID=A0ACB9WWC3_CHAAC|nr:hypothetical protein KUCAC02_011573 [Chaenocephalus aceratus]